MRTLDIFRDTLGLDNDLKPFPAEDDLTLEQKEALSVLNSGANVFLTGGAGTGKSFLINRFKALNKGKSILLTAPTGIAAQQIGGATLHRTFKIPSNMLSPHEQQKHVKAISSLLRSTDIVIIDEISMCREDVFTYVVRFIAQENLRRGRTEKKAPIQLICVGDFFQLPPVITNSERECWRELWGNSEGFAFQSKAWEYMQIKTIALTEVVRQKDNAFATALNNIRLNNESGLDYLNNNRSPDEIEDAIFLCSKNQKADDINYLRLQELDGDEYEFKMEKNDPNKVIKRSDLVCDEVLSLKEGARVMLLVNDYAGAYQNGSFGTVVKIMSDEIMVLLDTSRVVVSIKPHKWTIFDYELGESEDGRKVVVPLEKASYTQFPLKLAYAITIHKSQGQTYDSVNIDVQDIFANGQLYVALSRCRSIQNTYFNMPLTTSKLKVSKTVLEQYRMAS